MERKELLVWLETEIKKCEKGMEFTHEHYFVQGRKKALQEIKGLIK